MDGNARKKLTRCRRRASTLENVGDVMTKAHYKIMRSPDETPLLRDKPRSSAFARNAAATLGDWAIRCAFQNRLISRRTLSMNLVTDGACRFCNP